MNPCPDPDLHPCIVCGVERPHAQLIRTDGGLRCRVPCIPPVVSEVTMPRPVPVHRRPRSWIVSVGPERLIVSLEDRPHQPAEVARLIADHAAVAIGEATGRTEKPVVREARYYVDPEP